MDSEAGFAFPFLHSITIISSVIFGLFIYQAMVTKTLGASECSNGSVQCVLLQAGGALLPLHQTALRLLVHTQSVQNVLFTSVNLLKSTRSAFGLRQSGGKRQRREENFLLKFSGASKLLQVSLKSSLVPPIRDLAHWHQGSVTVALQAGLPAPDGYTDGSSFLVGSAVGLTTPCSSQRHFTAGDHLLSSPQPSP